MKTFDKVIPIIIILGVFGVAIFAGWHIIALQATWKLVAAVFFLAVAAFLGVKIVQFNKNPRLNDDSAHGFYKAIEFFVLLAVILAALFAFIF